mmetsp:Transcript_10249/g.24030  ORF Transcript_10249/g.24030 Transcript_10249/m.24030 type:complete len:220 (+) Transcript_10249:2013-2672(+)
MSLSSIEVQLPLFLLVQHPHCAGAAQLSRWLLLHASWHSLQDHALLMATSWRRFAVWKVPKCTKRVSDAMHHCTAHGASLPCEHQSACGRLQGHVSVTLLTGSGRHHWLFMYRPSTGLCVNESSCACKRSIQQWSCRESCWPHSPLYCTRSCFASVASTASWNAVWSYWFGDAQMVLSSEVVRMLRRMKNTAVIGKWVASVAVTESTTFADCGQHSVNG